MLIHLSPCSSNATAASGSSEKIPKAKAEIQISFIDALLNSITKGKGALKATCKMVWHSNEPNTIIEQSQCQKAKKEIAMAKREYPQILATVDRLKYYANSSERNISNDMSALAELNLLANKCKNQTATRAAKTMDYWGTKNEGDWYYENLYNMGAERASEVLDSCKEDSWLYQAINDIDGSTIKSWDSLQIFASTAPKKYCLNPTNTNSWTTGFLDKTKIKLNELKGFNKIINYFETNPATAARVLPSEGLNKLSIVSKNLSKETSNCSQIAQRGEQILAIRAKTKKDNEIRAAAAERARQRAAAAAAAREAEAKRQRQIHEEAIQGVTLE